MTLAAITPRPDLEANDLRHPPSAAGLPSESVQEAIEQACALVPPLWTLRNFVAVNPFLGLRDKPFSAAIVDIERIRHAEPLLAIETYRRFFEKGRICEVDLDEAMKEASVALERPDLAGLHPDVIRSAMFGRGPSHQRVPTYSELVDLVESSEWSRMIVEEIAKFCAGRFDAGQSSWPQPHADRSLYSAWRKIAQLDRAPEVRGLIGFRAFVRSLPLDPRACIEQVLGELSVPEADVADVLARELATLSGWAGHLQYRIRQAAMSGASHAKPAEDRLSDLLAIRLAFDGALLRVRSTKPGLESWASAREGALGTRSHAIPQLPVQAAGSFADLEIRHLWQLALEAAYRRDLIARVTAPKDRLRLVHSERLLQAAFCIDVRSERLRRHLEERTDRIQTIGFAGFFGLPIEAIRAGEETGEPRCPALLSPAFRVPAREDRDPAALRARTQRERFHSLFKQLRLSSVSAFPFVETIGQSFALRLVTDSLGWTRPGADSRLFSEPRTGGFEPALESEESGDGSFGIALDRRIELAEGMLRNMGLTEGFAPYVLFCGHGSTTTNNPYASALDCGACGGYSGDINARAAASLVNDSEVRDALVARGIEIPGHTRFLAGLHDTTTDEILLFDLWGIPEDDLGAIQCWLDEAAAATRQERAADLGLDPKSKPAKRIRRRSRDWSELRPEWGLAGNAAFIAGPRDRTRGLDLDGRCFLHDYHADRDPEGQVLELILTAPLVVASWINLQYFASTVDNEKFGSGTKTIHNVVGRHGVLSGNGGDLRVGLPFQSVHDGERSMHEPMRLTAVVEAPNERIERILRRHADLRDLVANRWIHLISIDPDGAGVFRWTSRGFQRIGDDEGERE